MARSGIALILVAGVLGLLAVLATTFATMAQLERRASAQRLYATKATLLARSGLEDALARLSAGQDPSLAGSRYGGEDWDADGSFSAYEAGEEVFNPTGAGTSADVATCPVRHAMRPSFAARIPGSSNPVTQGVDGRLRGYSGRSSGDRDGGNVYALKIEDESAKINVNGGFLDGGNRDNDAFLDHQDPDVRPDPTDPKDTGLSWNGQLTRILGILVQQPELGLPPMPTAGTDILLGRPLGGYRSVREVEQVLGTKRDLSAWLTTSSWSDQGVVHPNGYDTQPLQSSLCDVKLTRKALRPEEEGRPPVNLNAAARPVLVVLIQGLRGTDWFYEESPATYEIQAPMAEAIADALVAGRPFGTWSQFEAFCDALVPAVISGFDAPVGGLIGGGNLAGADLIKANLNPNSRLNKQFPDQLMWHWIDKSDLTVWSTEGNLGPTGTFRISSVGRVTGADGKVRAERTASVLAEAFSLLRQSSQRDFVAGRTLVQEDPPGSGLHYLSRTLSSLLPTSGAWASAAWWGGTPPGRGLAVMTYPCPPTALPGEAAAFDGAIGLATVEGAPDPKLRFLHHFDDSWDADLGAPAARVTPAPSPFPGTPPVDAELQEDLTRSVWPDPDLPAPANRPNTLCPDGFQAQKSRIPSFAAAGNFPPSFTPGDPAPSNHGVIGYWVKTLQKSVGASKHVSILRTSGFLTQCLATGQTAGGWGILVEHAAQQLDPRHERASRILFDGGAATLPGLRWVHMMAHFDTDTDEEHWREDVRAEVRGVRSDGVLSEYGVSMAPAWALREDLLASSPLLTLGPTSDVYGADANQVLDELAIADFGDEVPDALQLATEWSAIRFKDGRYDKGGKGDFLSAPLDPGGPGRLLRVAWTECLPRENRMEYLSTTGPVAGLPRLLDSRLPGAALKLTLLDENATPLASLAQGRAVQRQVGRFRYHVRFLVKPLDPVSGVPDPMNQPVLESPWFDDITFAFQPASGPRVTAWERP